MFDDVVVHRGDRRAGRDGRLGRRVGVEVDVDFLRTEQLGHSGHVGIEV